MAQTEDIKRILVRAPNWIGDAVMCLPALESLKALYRTSFTTIPVGSTRAPRVD
jgi:heptosyltransferase-2